MQGKLLLGLLFYGIGLAQTDPPLRLGPFHNLPKPGSIQVLVELPTGMAVKAADFVLLEDGRRTSSGSSLAAFPNSSWKVALVLALDVSRSITASELDQIKQASAEFVSQVKVPVALITFADAADTSAGFETSPEGVTAAIARLRPIGKKTRLYDALDKALGLLENRPAPERQRIIVISDGAEDSQAGADALDNVLDRAQGRRIPIDTIWVPTKTEGARNTLVRASERTDGLHADAKQSQSPEILTALNQVLDRIDKAVVVSFERKLDSSGATTRAVGITVDRAGVSAATIPLRIPASPPPRSWLDWFGSLVTFLTELRTLLGIFGGVVTTYGAYTAYFLAVKKQYGETAAFQRFPFDPIHFRPTTRASEVPPPKPTPTPTPTPTPASNERPEQRSRRVTVVERAAEPARANGLVLQAVTGPFEGQRISVETEHFRIGADPDNDLSIAADDFVSGRHALIQAVKGEWLLIDQGSRNGTFVDGQRLERGPGQVLRRGQSIRLGNSEFRVILEEDAKVARAPSMPVR